MRRLLALLLLAGLPAAPAVAATLPPPPRATYNLLNTPLAGERLFLRACGVNTVVDSAYLYEANLLDYSTPVADIDYMVNVGAQCVISLPGFSADRYLYAGAVNVYGSGWVLKFRTPNGGRFAFLHVSRPYTPALVGPRLAGPVRHPAPVTVDGDNNTARAIGGAPTVRAGYQLAVYPGTSAVGVSGWPTDPYYGNGGSGATDAHLCFLLDQRAADWFYAILTGAHHRPVAPFRLALWNRWTLIHHRPAISPWDGHHHLIWAASVWRSNQWLGGVKDHGHWYAPNRRAGRRYGFTQTEFGGGSILCWPHYHRCKTTRH